MKIVTIAKRGTAAHIEAVLLGKLGMYSGKYIAERTGLSIAQVYAVLKAFDINLRDIRNYGNEFNNRVADLARHNAAENINDLKAAIARMLPPPKPEPTHETARQ